MSRIAVMMSQNSADAPMSSHFGKAPWIMIADGESGAREFVGNETLNGRGAALAIADRGCGDVIVVDLGAGALRHLQMTQVSAWAAPAGTAGSDALRLFAENKLPAAAAHEGESQHGGCCCGHGGAAATPCCRS